MILTAIISCFNSEHLIKRCIDNLLNQTIFINGDLEIIVVDGGSSQKELNLIEPYQSRHENISFLESQGNESLYSSWNRGIRIAKGKYITNANTDDRHHKRCLELLVNRLEQRPESDLAYGTLYKSLKLNESFDQNDKSIPCTSQEFFAGSLLLHDFTGAQPVWRKSIHKRIGLFDESYDVVGDYEFVLRALTHGCKFSYVQKAEGLMLWHKNALSTKNSKVYYEKKRLYDSYRNTDKICEIYKDSECTVEDAYLDLGIRSLCFYPQFNEGNPSFDFDFAKKCFSYSKTNSAFVHNLKTIEKIVAFVDSNKSFNKSELKDFYFYSSRQAFPPEYILKGYKPIYLKQFDSRKLNGRKYQTYTFSLALFENFFFGALPLNKLSILQNLYICGYNQKGILLGNWLNKKISTRLTYLDTNAQNLSCSKMKVLNYKEGINYTENSAFILTMSSHHWTTVTTQIRQRSPNAQIYKLDHS